MTMPKGWNPNQTNDGQLYLGPENVIWKNDVMTGIFNRKVVETQVITNLRVLQNARSIALSDLDDIIIMNQHSESQFQGGRYYVRGSGMSYGTGRSSGKSIGDIAFIYQGQPSIVFRKIVAPSGVVRLAKAARKSMIQQIKIAERQQAKLLKEQEKQRKLVEIKHNQRSTSRTKSRATVSPNGATELTVDKMHSTAAQLICHNCQSSNPPDAAFCGMCGMRLAPRCSNCGRDNPSGSGFCNECGFALT